MSIAVAVKHINTVPRDIVQLSQMDTFSYRRLGDQLDNSGFPSARIWTNEQEKVAFYSSPMEKKAATLLQKLHEYDKARGKVGGPGTEETGPAPVAPQAQAPKAPVPETVAPSPAAAAPVAAPPAAEAPAAPARAPRKPKEPQPEGAPRQGDPTLEAILAKMNAQQAFFEGALTQLNQRFTDFVKEVRSEMTGTTEALERLRKVQSSEMRLTEVGVGLSLLFTKQVLEGAKTEDLLAGARDEATEVYVEIERQEAEELRQAAQKAEQVPPF